MIPLTPTQVSAIFSPVPNNVGTLPSALITTTVVRLTSYRKDRAPAMLKTNWKSTALMTGISVVSAVCFYQLVIQHRQSRSSHRRRNASWVVLLLLTDSFQPSQPFA